MVTDVKRTYKSSLAIRSCNVCAFYKFSSMIGHYWDLCRKAQIGC